MTPPAYASQQRRCRPLLSTVGCGNRANHRSRHRSTAKHCEPPGRRISTKSSSPPFEAARPYRLRRGRWSILRKPCAPHIPMLAAAAVPRFSAARMVVFDISFLPPPARPFLGAQGFTFCYGSRYPYWFVCCPFHRTPPAAVKQPLAPNEALTHTRTTWA